jgi:hypothetical protein
MEWLDALGAARISPTNPPPQSTISITTGEGLTRATLACPGPATASSAAVASLVLQEFHRSRPGRQGLARPVQMEVVQGPELREAGSSAAAPQGRQQQRQQPQQQLVINFTAAGVDAATAQELHEVAAAFEAYLQFHIKAAKSGVHTRMRQRLVRLRQQLTLARQPAPADPLVAC